MNSEYKIPKMFTDMAIDDEIAKVNHSINDYDKAIAQCNTEILHINNANMRLKIQRDMQWEADYNNGFGGAKLSCIEDVGLKLNSDNVYKYSEYIREYTQKKSIYKAKKRKLCELKRISPIERMELHYQRLIIDAKNAAFDEKRLAELVNEFREMGCYKNAEALATDCNRKAINVKYNRLVQEKGSASTEKEYQELAGQFRGMNGYKDTAELASECNKRYRTLKERREEHIRQEEEERKQRELQEEERKRQEEERKLQTERRNRQTHYNGLVHAMNNASTEKEYCDIALEFQKIGDYNNAITLASECVAQQHKLGILRQKQEKRNLLIGGVLGGIIGGLVLAFLFPYAKEYRGALESVGAIISVGFGLYIGFKVDRLGFVLGIVGFFGVSIVLSIIYAIITAHIIVSVIIGVVIGAIIGALIATH